jgi:DNA-binding protein HU-beta
MKKSELIERVAEKAETTRVAAARIVDAIFDTTSGAIAEAVKAGSHVSIPGFGKFTRKTRAARKGRNPKTGAEIQIPERVVVAFTPGRGLQDSLAGNGKPKRGAAGAGAAKGRGGKSTARAGAARAGKK